MRDVVDRKIAELRQLEEKYRQTEGRPGLWSRQDEARYMYLKEMDPDLQKWGCLGR